MRLDEWTKEEWWEVYRVFMGEVGEEEYERDWEEFQRRKKERAEKREEKRRVQ